MRYSERDVNMRSVVRRHLCGAVRDKRVGGRTRFFSTLHDEIVNHDPDVPLCACDDERRSAEGGQTRVDPCDDALSGGFFVSCGAIDLTCEE